MSDDVIFKRVEQYLEARGISDTSHFSLILDPVSGIVVLNSWNYPGVDEPNLAQLQVEMPRPLVLSTDNLKQVRDVRGKMLADTDFMFLGDFVPRAEVDMMSVVLFRKALRDVPQNITNPEDIDSCISVFPEPPPAVSFLVKKYPQVYS